MTSREAPAGPPPEKPHARLEIEEIEAALAKSVDTFVVKKPSSFPGIECVMRAEFSGGAPYFMSTSLINEKGKQVAIVQVKIERANDGQLVWDVSHRLTDFKERNQGFGSYVLATAEALVRTFNHRDPKLPLLIEIDAPGTPSVVGLARAGGYEIHDPAEKADYASFEEEVAKYGETEDWKLRGELPSYKLMKLDLVDNFGDRDGVVLDRTALAAFEQANPGIKDYKITPDYIEGEKRVRSEFEVLHTRYGRTARKNPLPFLLKVCLRKELAPLGK